MDRHDGWAVIICLIGGGQEINVGEAGIEEWLRALRDRCRVLLTRARQGMEWRPKATPRTQRERLRYTTLRGST